MKEIQVNNTESLLYHLNSLPNHFMFRGHSDSAWRLQSGLERLLGITWSGPIARTFEDFSLRAFKSKFHLYNAENKIPASKFAWLALMQHYGVPTRLLDFTESPYVALYFALETYDPPSGKDLSIYAVDYTAVTEASTRLIRDCNPAAPVTSPSLQQDGDQVFEKVLEGHSYDILWITEPAELNCRLDRQAGTFLFSGNIALQIEHLLTLPDYARSVLKFNMAKELYPAAFALLRKMNITSRSLYGDMAGLARSIRMSMQVYAAPDSRCKTVVEKVESPSQEFWLPGNQH